MIARSANGLNWRLPTPAVHLLESVKMLSEMQQEGARPVKEDATQPGVYDALAVFYERYWGKAFLDHSIRLFRSELAGRLKPADPVLELCCGTGHFSQWLAEEGYQVAGIDASRAMLAYARKRIEPTRLFHCDARSFFLPRRFRAIVCLYNSLNEFLEPGSVRAVLARAYHHLEPGGWFLFDVVSEQGYARFWTADEVVVDGQITCELRYRFDDRCGLASCSLTLGPSNVPSSERRQLLVQQRPYSIPSVVEELRFAGFELTLVKPLPDGVPQEGRVAILARRP